MQQCIKIYYSIFTWSSTCFGRHAAHYQEPKTALAASDLHNTVEDCWSVVVGHCQAEYTLPDSVQQPSTVLWKPEAASTVFGLLVMGGVSPKTCWASYKHGIINFYTLLHLVGFFFMNFIMMDGSTNIKIACVSILCSSWRLVSSLYVTPYILGMVWGSALRLYPPQSTSPDSLRCCLPGCHIEPPRNNI
jgi:hypothetical protein